MMNQEQNDLSEDSSNMNSEARVSQSSQDVAANDETNEQSNDIEEASEQPTEPVDVVNKIDDDDYDLYEAARAGDYDQCQMILQRGHCSREGKNVALRVASLMGRTNITRLLHESGADIDTRSDIGFTPIIGAAQQGKVDTVKYLVQAGADKNADNNYGAMAIHLASQDNRVEVVEYLIREAGVNPDVVSDQQ